MGSQQVCQNITWLCNLLFLIHRAMNGYSASFWEHYMAVHLAGSYTQNTERVLSKFLRTLQGCPTCCFLYTDHWIGIQLVCQNIKWLSFFYPDCCFLYTDHWIGIQLICPCKTLHWCSNHYLLGFRVLIAGSCRTVFEWPNCTCVQIVGSGRTPCGCPD